MFQSRKIYAHLLLLLLSLSFQLHAQLTSGSLISISVKNDNYYEKRFNAENDTITLKYFKQGQAPRLSNTWFVENTSDGYVQFGQYTTNGSVKWLGLVQETVLVDEDSENRKKNLFGRAKNLFGKKNQTEDTWTAILTAEKGDNTKWSLIKSSVSEGFFLVNKNFKTIEWFKNYFFDGETYTNTTNNLGLFFSTVSMCDNLDCKKEWLNFASSDKIITDRERALNVPIKDREIVQLFESWYSFDGDSSLVQAPLFISDNGKIGSLNCLSPKGSPYLNSDETIYYSMSNPVTSPASFWELHQVDEDYWMFKNLHSNLWLSHDGNSITLTDDNSSENTKWFVDLQSGRSHFIYRYRYTTRSLKDVASYIDETFRNLADDNKEDQISGLFYFKRVSNQCISGDCQNGVGTYVFSDGSIYEGNFKSGKPNGKGVLTKTDKSTDAGEFSLGTLLNGQRFSAVHQRFFDVVSGAEKISALNDFDKKNACISGNCETGYGNLIIPGTGRYNGNFKLGAYEGKGEYQGTLGQRIKGQFKNGLLLNGEHISHIGLNENQFKFVKSISPLPLPGDASSRTLSEHFTLLVNNEYIDELIDDLIIMQVKNGTEKTVTYPFGLTPSEIAEKKQELDELAELKRKSDAEAKVMEEKLAQDRAKKLAEKREKRKSFWSTVGNLAIAAAAVTTAVVIADAEINSSASRTTNTNQTSGSKITQTKSVTTVQTNTQSGQQKADQKKKCRYGIYGYWLTVEILQGSRTVGHKKYLYLSPTTKVINSYCEFLFSQDVYQKKSSVCFFDQDRANVDARRNDLLILLKQYEESDDFEEVKFIPISFPDGNCKCYD